MTAHGTLGFTTTIVFHYPNSNTVLVGAKVTSTLDNSLEEHPAE